MDGTWTDVARKGNSAIQQDIALTNAQNFHVEYLKNPFGSLENLDENGDLLHDSTDNNMEDSLTPEHAAAVSIPNISQAEIDQINKEHEALQRRAAWYRKSQQFIHEPIYSTEDLIIPYINPNPTDDNVYLDENDFVPIRRGWGICLLGIFAGR